MLNEFEPGELPGDDVEGASEDTTSYEMIEEEAKITFETCVEEWKLFGWMQTGMTFSRAFSTFWLSLEHYPKLTAFEYSHAISLLRHVEVKQGLLMLVLISIIRL